MSELDLAEAIELACRVIFETDDGTWKSWNQLPSATQDWWRDKARLAVETAAPLLERQVREKVAHQIEAKVWFEKDHGHDGHAITEKYAYRDAATIARGGQP